MNFEETLQDMVRDCPGAIGIALMGSDGIPVAQLQMESDDAGELLRIYTSRIRSSRERTAGACSPSSN